MTPADKRVMDLLERWLTSIELHLKYADLDTSRYGQVQPWPEHERPARWILELAQQKVLQLKTLCKARLADNDPAFSESLELMSFLANLIGSQQIRRFIPLADPARENADALAPSVATTASADTQTQTKPQAKPAAAAATTIPPVAVPKSEASVTPTRDADDTTREMPRVKASKRTPTAQERPHVQTANVQDSSATRKPPTKNVAQAKPTDAVADSNRMNELVIADAVRLLRWGREWHELTELIVRIAERPNAVEVRRILRSHRGSIETKLANLS